MTTLAVVRQAILSDLTRTGVNDLTVSAETEINTAIEYYQRERFWFLEARSHTNTQPEVEFYGLPDDFRDDDSLVLTVDGFTFPLCKVLYTDAEALFNGLATGVPSHYSIYDEQIRLWPVPNGQYQMMLSYQRKLAALTLGDESASNTNAWMVEGGGLIRARVEWLLFARKVRDYEAAKACKILMDEEYDQHKTQTVKRLLTGHTRKRSAWR